MHFQEISRQFFLTRENDRADLDDVGRDIGLIGLTKHAILSYALPCQQAEKEKSTAFTYLHSDAQNPICGTAHDVTSPEMFYVSGNSRGVGMSFRQSSKALK